MEYPADIIIKQEPDDYEYEEIKPFPTDVDVKIENVAPDEDWRIQNTALLDNIDKQFEEIGKEEQIECRLCEQYFVDRYSLLRHNLLHLRIILKRSIVYQCDICSSYFTTKHELKYHISTHVNTVNNHHIVNTKPKTSSKHQCDTCGKFLSYKSWHNHTKVVHSKEWISCLHCGKVFKCHSYLRKHNMYAHGGVKKKWLGTDEDLPCNECSKVFSNRHSLKTHKRNCHGKQHQCYICKSILKSKSYLMTHLLRVHYNDGKEHACVICDKKFKSPRYVKVHIRNSHVKENNKVIGT